MKKLFKYRRFEFWRIDITLFQDRRWDISVGLDCTEWPLLWFSFIFISIEFNLMKGFKEWKHPSREELERYRALDNLSEEDKKELILNNILKGLKDDKR